MMEEGQPESPRYVVSDTPPKPGQEPKSETASDNTLSKFSPPRKHAGTPSELYSLIKQKNWPEVRIQATDYPNEASLWIEEKDPDDSIRRRLLPIHQACEFHPTRNAMKSIILAHTKGLEERDSSGDLPIHLACRERASSNVINQLLTQYPEGAEEKDNEGRLPIHLACRQWAEIETINALLLTYCNGARCPDVYGLLPIHWACAQNASVHVIEALLCAFPGSICLKDKWGRMPLDLAMTHCGNDKGKIIEALNRDPSHWTSGRINKVCSPEDQFEQSCLVEKHLACKADAIEVKLMEVTAASSAAAKSFRDIKDSFQAENMLLNNCVKELSVQNKDQEHQIDDLMNENEDYQSMMDDLSRKLDIMSNTIKVMEEQKQTVLDITGAWDNALRSANELYH